MPGLRKVLPAGLRTGTACSTTRLPDSQNCQLPTRTTACVHMQAALQSVGAANVPDCDERGQFRQVQTDGRSGQAWCVNTRTGVEITGTRQNLGVGSLANVNCVRECRVPRRPCGYRAA